MQLYKRILISLFPDDLVSQPINPASMFISFISAKQYFSVINRKIVENYKLNLFDISLDSFDVKIGFGENASIKVNDIDFYYSYGVAANLNGYRFLAPSNIGSCISLVVSIYVKEVFEKDEYKYLNNFLIAVYLMTFIMVARLKTFPMKSKEHDYKRFIDTFFNFYKLVIIQTGEKINNQKFESIKKRLLQNIQVFFLLFYFYKKMNKIFEDNLLAPKEYYKLLFYDELKKGTYKILLGDFVKDCKRFTQSSSFTAIERKIMNLVFPADILIRYVFDGDDIFLVIDYLIKQIFDKKVLDKYMSGFLKNDDKFEDFMMYISDYNLFKNSFFKGLKTLTIHKFKNDSNYDIQEEMDELMSSVGSGENLENVKIPDKIKKESMMMERFINFFVTFIGSFWIARGDNFFLRLFRTDILDELVKSPSVLELKQDSLFFFGGLLYNYSKNVFYYKSAFDNVRAGKERFHLPFRSTFRKVYSNSLLIKLFDENFLANIIQDTYQKDIKIYIQNKDVLKGFKSSFGKEIGKIVKFNKKEIINFIYGEISGLLKDSKNFIGILHKSLKDNDILNLKESIYTIDFWIWFKIIQEMNKLDLPFSLKFSDFSIIGLLSIFRETIFAYLIFVKYLNLYQKSEKIEVKINVLERIYLLDVVGISNDYFDVLTNILDEINQEYGNIFEKWISFDDNKKYFEIGGENWIQFIQEKSDEKIITDISGEDIIWFRGYLKNITYYNKRYLIPKE